MFSAFGAYVESDSGEEEGEEGSYGSHQQIEVGMVDSGSEEAGKVEPGLDIEEKKEPP